ncbi:MAG: hypothetical protein AAB487_03490 [Patescibacteria group bacterium]
MIADTIRGDVFQASNQHIAFAVNTEGYNDAGFAGAVSSRHWPELANTGKKKLGDVFSKNVKGKTFHALVCHSLDANGWKRTAETVTKCLDSLNVPEDQTIAIVLMGAGMIGQMGGADVFAILGGMARSKKRVAIYTL